MQQTPDVPSEAPVAPFTPKFDGAGLLTAIVVDADGGSILMLAHMDKEALAKTRESGLAHFHSRSRQRLWMKGETSGNRLAVKRILTDCDEDSVVVRVERLGDGKTCHTGTRTCFTTDIELDGGAR